jgi:hypothetical protein
MALAKTMLISASNYMHAVIIPDTLAITTVVIRRVGAVHLEQ